MRAQPARNDADVVGGSEGARLDRANPLATNDLASLRKDHPRRDGSRRNEPRCRLYGEQRNHRTPERTGGGETS
jgi:hypothetical protein